jgi:hypothetical protein
VSSGFGVEKADAKEKRSTSYPLRQFSIIVFLTFGSGLRDKKTKKGETLEVLRPERN